jgi:cell division septum initiation protein DivIVA
MFPFSQPVSPFVRSHLDSHAAFFNELSRSLTNSFQNVFQANLQLSQSMFEETLRASQHMLAPYGATDAPGVDASRPQPTSDKMQVYQQLLSRLAADSHVDLARITQQHVQETARTAQAMSEEVTRAASEATSRNAQRLEASSKEMRDALDADAARGTKDA